MAGIRPIERKRWLACVATVAIAAGFPAAASAQDQAISEGPCTTGILALASVRRGLGRVGESEEIIDALCARLAEHDLSLVLDGEAEDMGRQVLSWSFIRLVRSGSGIIAPTASGGTRMFTPAIPTEDAIPIAKIEALASALVRLDAEFEEHLAALEAEEARLAAYFARQSAGASAGQ